MARVLVTDRVAEDLVEILRAGGAEIDLRPGMAHEDLVREIGDYNALVVRSETKVTAEVIEAGRNLQVVGRAGIGVDNIDVDAATRRGVVVVNAPEANTIAMAEHTIGLMLALARHIPMAHDSVRSGSWNRSKFIGVELRGKTLGLIGLGRTGAEVARRARGLEMNVIAVDPFIGQERFQMLGVRAVTHEELYAQSDFISLHAISNRPVLDEAEFKKLKPGVRIVNAARGNLVDEAALLAAIESGIVAGAALDVFSKEPPEGDSPLFRNERIIVTPHLGASTAEAQERVAVDAAQQVLAVLRGEPALYAVNLPFIGLEAFKVIAPFLQAATQAGSLATQLSTGQFERVEIEYLGELADLDVTPLKAAVIRGLLATRSDENVTLVNASMIAEQRGLKIIERKGHYDGVYNNLIRVRLSTSDGETTVSSTTAHDGPHIVEINDFWVDVSPGQGYLLICENLDRPGMIGRIGTFLGEHDVNISFMRVGREKARGRALMVLGLDEEMTPELMQQISAIPNIFSAQTARI
jgi:D-3-phosphoglycerate dehydrogenase / 2-oxoglutarate reductase